MDEGAVFARGVLVAPATARQALSRRRRWLGALAAADGLAAAACSLLALLWRFDGAPPAAHALPVLAILPLWIFIRLLTAHAFGLYDLRHRLSATDHAFAGAGAGISAAAIGYLVLAAIVLYAPERFDLSRLVALLDALLLCAWFAGSRALILLWLVLRGKRVRLAVIGPQRLCEEIEEAFAQAPRLLAIARMIVLPARTDAQKAAELLERAAQEAASGALDVVILLEPDLPQEALAPLLASCDHGPAELLLYPELELEALGGSRILSIEGVPFTPLKPALASTPYQFGKRLIDLAASAVLLIVLAPVMAAAAGAVLFGSGLPVLYRQKRVGRGGRLFHLYKLRTMRRGAEEADRPVLAEEQDRRITAVGRVLRRYRLDELPQLVNVLRGQMSLVGPRPERPAFVRQYAEENPLYARRLLVRPGMTGLAQIHGSYGSDYRHKLRFDMAYLNSASLATDLRIFIATLRTVLTGRGAR